jgi:AraC family transcriptional regulator, regulatory protein of adaptative response / methylated-DNA-[protein]-cysteine methyltransferase
MKKICQGNSITPSPADYESRNGFPRQINKQPVILKAACIDTILGPLVAIADDQSLYLLEFVTKRGLKQEVGRLRQRGFALIPGSAPPLTSIEAELNAYFDGKLTAFKTPYRALGTPFQQRVWEALRQIPYGKTRSYAEQSALLGESSAYRAVANANGANRLAIIIPCHRVIASDGTLGGYSAGLTVKQALINHEKRYHHVVRLEGYLSG